MVIEMYRTPPPLRFWTSALYVQTLPRVQQPYATGKRGVGGNGRKNNKGDKNRKDCKGKQEYQP